MLQQLRKQAMILWHNPGSIIKRYNPCTTKSAVRAAGQIENKVIEDVSKPTDWVNSLVIREKLNGNLRICLNPTDLNKAMKRPHYPTPTVEEIAPKSTGTKIFSKLDAKDEYWNIRLDDKSSLS